METSAPSTQVKTQRKVGGFELGEKIGQGGMGAVFKARQISLDRVVALKLLPPKIARKNPLLIERFLREARLSAKLNHANIVQGIDVGFDESHNIYFFAMEYVDGPTLRVVLDQQKIIPERKALEIIKSITQALICAHRAGVVHRDIKPDNILLTSRGEPKLADLGLAHFVLDVTERQGAEEEKNDNNDNAELTQSGFTVGTPNYMSPEQVRGQSAIVDARSDLYSLGATLFHLVTGRAPFVAETISQIMQLHLQAPIPDARSVNPQVSEDTSRLITQLMQKEQIARIQTAESLDEQIANILATLNRNQTITEPLTRGATSKHQPVENVLKHNEPQSVEAPPKSRASWMYVVIAGALGICAIIIALVISHESDSSENRDIVQQPSNNLIEPINPQPNPQITLTNIELPPIKPPSPTPSTPPLQPKEKPPLKWAPLEKALEDARQQPEDYQNLIRAFTEAERGAPPKLIKEIRRHRDKVEREQRQAFHKALTDFNANAQAKLKQKDYIGAIGALQEEICPPNLLSEYTRGKLSKARKDIETNILNDYLKLQETLRAEMATASQKLPLLETFTAKLRDIERQYDGVLIVTDKLNTLQQQLVIYIEDAKDNLTKQQDIVFKQRVNSAYQIASRGDLQEAEIILNKAVHDELLERFNTKLRQLIADIQAVRSYLQKAQSALMEKMKTNTELTLHHSGMTITGRLTGKNAEDFLLEDKDARIYNILLIKLDPWELVALSGAANDDTERRYAVGICYFWLGKQAKAYEVLSQLKKGESQEFNRAALYLVLVEEVVHDMMNQARDIYRKVMNSKLKPDEIKVYYDEARAIIQRLKLEYSEAYRVVRKK